MRALDHIGSKKKVEKKITLRRPHLSLGGGQRLWSKTTLLYFFFRDPSLIDFVVIPYMEDDDSCLGKFCQVFLGHISVSWDSRKAWRKALF